MIESLVEGGWNGFIYYLNSLRFLVFFRSLGMALKVMNVLMNLELGDVVNRI